MRRAARTAGAERARRGGRLLLRRGDHRGGTFVMGLAVAETVSWGVLYYAFGVLLQPIQEETGWSRTLVSGAFSTALLASAVAAPLVGWIVDHRGAHVLMTAGAVAGAVAFGASALVDSIAGLYACWTAIGLVMACVLYEPAFAAIARRHDGDDRLRAITTVTLVAGLASTIFVPATTSLVATHGWRIATLSLAAVLAMATVPLHAMTLREPAVTVRRPSTRSGSAPRRALASRAFRQLGIVFMAGSFVSAAIGAHAVACLSARGMTAAGAAGAVGGLGVMQVIARLVLHVSASSTRWLTAGTFLLQAAGVTALVVLDGVPGVALFVVAFGMGNGLATLARATVVADVFGARHYGTIAGALATPATLSRALAPVAAGALFEATGSYSAVLSLMAALLVLAAAMAVDMVVSGTASSADGPAEGPFGAANPSFP